MMRRMMQLTVLMLAGLLVASPVYAQKDKKSKDAGPGIALITLKGSLSDGPGGMANPLTGSSGDTLRSVQDRLTKAAKDADVKALALYMEGFSADWTVQNELRQSLADFRKSGKKAYCYLETASMGGYLVGAACDEITLPPVGGIEIPGVRFEMSFYKDLMEKVGVKGDIVPLGDFKAAGEPFSRSKMSDANRKQWDKMADDYYELLADTIAQSRKGFDTAKAKAAIDVAMYTPKAAVEAGLADKIGYFNETIDEIKKSVGDDKLVVRKDYGKTKEDVDLSNPFALLKMLSSSKETKMSDKPKVAVIYANGAIESGKGGFGLMGESMGSTTMVELIRKAGAEPTVKVIVLRIDSPGGSALASDLIWKATMEAKKPIIVSMGAVAGSGGYYIACGADKIYAEPGTITGSIGVISMKFVLGGVYEKLGINNEVVSRGKRSDFGSSDRAFTEEERGVMLTMMGDVYDTFLSRVMEGRKKAGKDLKLEDLKKVAGGRIWTGHTAKEIGLIDEVGTLDDAIAFAKKKVGLEDKSDVELWFQPKGKGSFLDSLFETQVTARLQAMISSVPGLQKHLQIFDVVSRHPHERIWLMSPYSVQSK
ncbi:MAG: signal peptide peptidase SppA [Gemmatales bacterium]